MRAFDIVVLHDGVTKEDVTIVYIDGEIARIVDSQGLLWDVSIDKLSDK